MLLLKLYLFIAVMFYIFLGLFMFKKGYIKVVSPLAILIISIFWLPFSVYVILTEGEE